MTIVVTLYCDFGDSREVACGLVEPLQFEDGYADVDDEDQAAQIVARHKHIHFPRQHPDASPESSDPSSEFDAESFVDRIPMSDVIDDIESGVVDHRLDAIEAAESAGKDRIGVQEAIDERR